MLRNIFVTDETKARLTAFAKSKKWLLRPTVAYLIDYYYTSSRFAHYWNNKTKCYDEEFELEYQDGQRHAVQVPLDEIVWANLKFESTVRHFPISCFVESVIIAVLNHIEGVQNEQ